MSLETQFRIVVAATIVLVIVWIVGRIRREVRCREPERTEGNRDA